MNQLFYDGLFFEKINKILLRVLCKMLLSNRDGPTLYSPYDL
jgi:hypothetical protein